ncbi:MAG TPA: response regulator [Tepidisphaeraceae bacterium]|nr:response regulator [Tepidisphaeraceae bacterium]
MQDHSSGIVHIIDDDAGMRNSLFMLVTSAALAARVYASAEEFLHDAGGQLAGCIVLDLRMPGMSGMDLLQRLRADGNPLPVVVISGHADVPTTVRGMKLGAVDVLTKPVEPATMIEAIRNALRLSTQLQDQQQQSQTIRQRFTSLTSRELELLRCVVAGLSSKQIASQLGISIKTVANHRANLMAKTGALNAADLARLSTLAGIATASAGPVIEPNPPEQRAM